MKPQLALVASQPAEPAPPRADHDLIALMVGEGARVLEVGCGAGELLALLARERKAKVFGIEIAQDKARACVAHGFSVIAGDAETDLPSYPAEAFDYVIFSRTLQCLNDPRRALAHARRIGARTIVSVVNGAHWRCRLSLLTSGRMPQPRIGDWRPQHLWSVRDSVALAQEARLKLERGVSLTHGRPGAPFAQSLWRANWFAPEAVLLLAP
jgi:methionine biosynthesis protein MetW